MKEETERRTSRDSNDLGLQDLATPRVVVKLLEDGFGLRQATPCVVLADLRTGLPLCPSCKDRGLMAMGQNKVRS